MGKFTDRMSKESVALVVAVLILAGSLVLGQRAVTSQGDPSASASPTGGTSIVNDRANTVVAVNSDSAEAAERAWNATSLRTLPGSVLVITPATSVDCAATEVESSQAAKVVTDAVTCSQVDPQRSEAMVASLSEAAATTKGRYGSLVLLGDGWTKQAPVALTSENADNPMALAVAIKQTQEAGLIPDMTGIDVVMAGPPPTAESKLVWEAYLTAAGANSVEWAVTRAAESPTASPTP